MVKTPKANEFDPKTGEIAVEPVDDGATDDGAEYVADLALDTLSGDLRDALLTRFQHTQKPWAQMSEMEQRDLVNGFDMAARYLVRETVKLLTGWEFPRAAVTLGEVKIKGEKGIEAKITCPNNEVYRTVLGEAVGQQVLVLIVDSDNFLGERAPVKIDPDQAKIPLDDADGDMGD